MALILPPRFRFFHRQLKNKKFSILDIGAGSHSPTITKKYFKNCEYHGVDIGNYNNSDGDMQAMDRYFEMDVTKLKFDEIPGNYYDVIMLSHIIEHLYNGDKVVEGLLPKLKKGGLIYIEYPGERSTHLPKMKSTLNFYDDVTHVRVFSIPEIAGLLTNNGCQVLKSGTRRYWPYMLLMPMILVYKAIQKGQVQGGTFWDILGFAEYVYAKKK